MGPGEMGEVASCIGRVLRAPEDAEVAADVLDVVHRLCAKFTPYPER